MEKEKKKLKGTKREVYSYIVKYYNKHGYMPSYREVMAATHLKSTSSVCSYMAELFDEGYFETEHPGSARAFRLAPERSKA